VIARFQATRDFRDVRLIDGRSSAVSDDSRQVDWSQCTLVESIPGKVSGASVVLGIRMPVQTIVDNYDAGMLPADIAEAWDISLKEVHDVLDYREVRLIQQRMLGRAKQHLMGQGASADEAKKLATAALTREWSGRSA
jgi:uncharacterized protein (DUF433 family)